MTTSGCNNGWREGWDCQYNRDSAVGTWTVSGRDWGDNYHDQNISRESDQHTGAGWRHLAIKNTGDKYVEIFALGVIETAQSSQGGTYIQAD